MSELSELYAAIARCQKCALARTRTHAVPGEGPEDAKIMFIGEAPGFHEDKQGRPFVGAAGIWRSSSDFNRRQRSVSYFGSDA